MSTTDHIPELGYPLGSNGEAFVKKQLFTMIREHGDRLREETGGVDVRLDTLVLDVYDELDREPVDRHALFRAALALTEHTNNMHKTAETMQHLAWTVNLGWAPDEDA